jgi:hypothetical protein
MDGITGYTPSRNPGIIPGFRIRFILILILSAVACGFAEPSPTSPVRITADVQSNIFSYEVENQSGRAILGIRFPQHGTYSYTLPDGWNKQVDGPIFHAWTDQRSRSIRPGEKGLFSMRVSSYGAVLGKGSIIVELGEGQTLTVPDIWVPVKEPIGYIRLVAGSILAILLAHAAGSELLARRARRRQAR